jgi:hypothetical protein
LAFVSHVKQKIPQFTVILFKIMSKNEVLYPLNAAAGAVKNLRRAAVLPRLV